MEKVVRLNIPNYKWRKFKNYLLSKGITVTKFFENIVEDVVKNIDENKDIDLSSDDIVKNILDRISRIERVAREIKARHERSVAQSQLSAEELIRMVQNFKKELEKLAPKVEEIHRKKKGDPYKYVVDLVRKYLDQVPVIQRREFIGMILCTSPMIEVALDKFKILQ